MTPDTDEAAVCAACGAVAAVATPVHWSVGLEGGRRIWTCDRCARENVRAIEAKLDTVWW